MKLKTVAEFASNADIETKAADRALRDVVASKRTDLKATCLSVALSKTAVGAPVEDVLAYAERVYVWLTDEAVN